MSFGDKIYKKTEEYKISILLCTIIIIGASLRLFFFTTNPPGLQQDEMAAGYEAYALLVNGTERWGYAWPSYFPAWGSGMNVLLSYLMIPLIKVFGLNAFSIRFIPVLLGILIVPVIFWATKKQYGQKIALYASLLVATLPWNIIASRWGLESNIMPFFFLLGVMMLAYALEWNTFDTPKKKMWVLLSLLPFALAIYAYAIAFVVLPLFFFLIFIRYYNQFIRNIKYWIMSVGMFFITAFPFLFFIFKNNIAKKTFDFEKYLPFSAPLLAKNRIDQVGGSFVELIEKNIQFLANFYHDGQIWNAAPGFPPLGVIIFPFFIWGIVLFVRKKKFDIFFCWFISCIPLLFLIELNINRGNIFFIPIIAIGAYGICEGIGTIKQTQIRNTLQLYILIAISAYSLIFSVLFFSEYPKRAAYDFNAGLDIAFTEAQNYAGNDPVFITDHARLNYVYVLYFTQTTPQEFLEHVEYKEEDGIYQVYSYKNYFYKKEALPDSNYVFIRKSVENTYCKNETNIYNDGIWIVGRCDL